MCGRFVMKSSQRELADFFELAAAVDVPARYNIAPTDAVLAVTDTGQGRHWRVLRWGLVPSWAKDVAIGARMINARSETVFDKPSFRAAVRRRRCLVPADGFYEWGGSKGQRQPYYISMADGRPFAMAAIWERWQNELGDEVESCALLTTSANSLIEKFHHRMPVILEQSKWHLWLGPDCEDRGKLEKLMVQYPSRNMMVRPVGHLVDNPRNEGEQLIIPLAEEA
jgi:putative SOS response-associated peptidase YedK